MTNEELDRRYGKLLVIVEGIRNRASDLIVEMDALQEAIWEEKELTDKRHQSDKPAS